MLNYRPSMRGFTLTEMLIGVTIALMLLAGLVMVFSSSSKQSSDVMRSTRQNQDLRGAMAMMVRDLRRAGYWGQATGGTGAGASYVNPFAAIGIGVPGCIVFRYDRNANGSVDSDENFGFRLNAGAIEAMTAGNADDCADALNQWEAITDPKINQVTALTFELAEQVAPVTGGGEIAVRRIGIKLDGQPFGEAAAAQKLDGSVRVRNDLYRP